MGRILIAEDEISVSNILAMAIQDMGHEVYVSPNGEHALETLQHNEKFDLLISDMKMPKMDGRQLLEEVYKRDEFADLPVIIISGYVRLAEIDDLLKAGAMAFLPKPLKLDELESYVNSAVPAPETDNK